MGGPIMWPLLLFSVIVTAISLERLIFLLYHNLKIDDIKQRIDSAFMGNNTKETIEFLDGISRKKMAARVFSAVLKNRNLNETRLEKIAEAEAIKCINSLENGFNILTAFGSISPLTGFLGTVTGMIGAFRSIAEAENISAQIVAGGIYEALITTVFGLIIAIAAMSFHSFFSSRVDKFALDIEEYYTELINKPMETSHEES